MSDRSPVLILGIGNLLWSDEGFGVRCVEALHHRFELPAGVRLLDGGTQGLYLVGDVCSADRVLVLDAIDFGDPPGMLRVIAGEDVPRLTLGRKTSMHQVGFTDVLAAAELLGTPPREVVIVGVQPAELEDYGGSLTPLVSARLDDALAATAAQLAAWGYPLCPRAAPAEPLLGPGLDRGTYESLRPTAEEACRAGDPRVLGRIER